MTLRLVMGGQQGCLAVAHQSFPDMETSQTQKAMGKAGSRIGRESRHLRPQLAR